MNDKRKLYKKCGWISVGVAAVFIISVHVLEARIDQLGWFSEEGNRLADLYTAAQIGGTVFLGVAVICFLASLISKIKHSTSFLNLIIFKMINENSSSFFFYIRDNHTTHH